ncbi:hypothetical protein Hypma_014496 [Hypsizygus marmoreus]|uniref:Uncharacterized protein n=1 Tax=Hypsizygus marmoreus TaxID=39966 RepID=A0A369JHC3_HYPMA|nr:hypothetical protein Hypma_014496 [Hypsizygus marmoreus]
MDLGVIDRLMAARAKAKHFDKQARAWLQPDPSVSKPTVQEVMRLVNRAEKDFSIPSIDDLKRTAEIALDLEKRCEKVLRNTYEEDQDHTLRAIQQWRTYGLKHLSMFALPSFDKLNTQMKLREQWIKDLPWYCHEHGEPYGQPVYDDVINCTNPENDLPPTDEYFTCICNTPVRPPPGTVSDAVQCDHCYARFMANVPKMAVLALSAIIIIGTEPSTRNAVGTSVSFRNLLHNAPEMTKRTVFERLETIRNNCSPSGQIVRFHCLIPRFHMPANQSRFKTQDIFTK